MSSGDFTWQGVKRQLEELRARVEALEAKTAPIIDLDSYHVQPVSLDEVIVDGPIGDYNVSRSNWFGTEDERG